MFCYSLALNVKGDLERVLYFPNKEVEEVVFYSKINKIINFSRKKLGEIKFELIFDLFSNELLQISSQKPIKPLVFEQIIKNCSKENRLFVEIIKSFLTTFS